MKLQITIDGKAYEVEVEVLEDDASPRPPSYAQYQPVPAGQTQAQAIADDFDNDKVCRSPATGLVIKVNVEAGQAVEANELVMVVEAMKMETLVTAPRAATVKSVNAAPGDSVKMGQVLVEFE